MALPETNVSVTAVKNELGSGEASVGGLCTEPLVNQWSKKKPVMEDGIPNWWDANNPTYGGNTDEFGITVPKLTAGLSDLSYDDFNDWYYHIPRGDINVYPLSGFKLGGFRGYDHSSIAPINVNVFPTGNVRDYVARSWNQIINTASAGLTVSDFGLQNYYIGILIEWGATWEFSYVQTAATPLSSGAVNIPFDIAIVPFDRSYIGGYRWRSFVCSQEITSGEASRWRTLSSAITANSGALVRMTPSNATGISGDNKGVFNANLTVTPSATAMSLGYNNGDTNSITVDVTPNNLACTITTNVSWLSINGGTSKTGDFTLGVTAVGNNDTGASRTGTVTITESWGDVAPVLITINQLINPI